MWFYSGDFSYIIFFLCSFCFLFYSSWNLLCLDCRPPLIIFSVFHLLLFGFLGDFLSFIFSSSVEFFIFIKLISKSSFYCLNISVMCSVLLRWVLCLRCEYVYMYTCVSWFLLFLCPPTFFFFILVSEFIVRDIPEISGVLGTLLSAVQC